jgi:hypothetical protein
VALSLHHGPLMRSSGDPELFCSIPRERLCAPTMVATAFFTSALVAYESPSADAVGLYCARTAGVAHLHETSAALHGQTTLSSAGLSPWWNMCPTTSTVMVMALGIWITTGGPMGRAGMPGMP